MSVVADDPLDALLLDRAIHGAIFASDHPDCMRFVDWLLGDMIPALADGREPGRSRKEAEVMAWAAIRAVVPLQ